MDFGQTFSLSYFPPLPAIEEFPRGENTQVRSDAMEIQDMQTRIEVLESEYVHLLLSLMSILTCLQNRAVKKVIVDPSYGLRSAEGKPVR